MDPGVGFFSSVQSALGSPPVQADHVSVPVSAKSPNFGLGGLNTDLVVPDWDDDALDPSVIVRLVFSRCCNSRCCVYRCARYCSLDS